MFGYHGRILHINLTTQSFNIQYFAEDYARKYFGANGFAAQIMYERMRPGIDPFSPENIVIFAVGPITDTPIPGCSRAYVATKSPLSNLFFDSTFGGRFAITQKRTGFEAIVISGRAASPVYLVVDAQGVQFRDASTLWGLMTDETASAIQDAEGENVDSVCIGPAGENLVRYACLVHHWRGRSGIAGRGGIGSVLGAKNIKALVAKGIRKTKIADPTALRELIDSRKETLDKNTAVLRNLGTSSLTKMINAAGGLGIRNFQDEFKEDPSALTGEVLKERFFERNDSCYGCSIACGKTFRLSSSPGALRWKMPEYETLFALGSMLDNWDGASLLKLNALSDRYGLDTISMGMTLAFAFECYGRGLLSSQYTDRRDLNFGDSESIMALVEDIGHRRGFGDLLADGSFRLAERLGIETKEFLFCNKKVELAGHSARALKGMAIGYATSTRGGSHHDARPPLQYTPEFDRKKIDGQPEFAVRTQNFTALGDSLTQCRFIGERAFGGMINENYVKMINAVTGWSLTQEDVEKIGSRIYTLERLFNCREGVTRKDDCLPVRDTTEPIPSGPSKGMYCPPQELQGMLDEYYKLRGWGRDGIPSLEKLAELDLI